MVNAQEWLDENYPKDGRKEIKKLEIQQKSLEGSLDLSDFVNLEELHCWENQLTVLNLSNCLKLKVFHCFTNQLTSLDLTNLNQLEWLNYGNNHLSKVVFPPQIEKLIGLDIAINDFPPHDCSVFNRLSNLQYLDIRSTRFYGSLELLKNSTKLWLIDVSNTDIDSGLEYLPESIKNLYFSSDTSREGAKVKMLEQELRKYGEPAKEENWRHYNFANLLPAWRKANPDKMKIVQQKRQIEELNNKLSHKQGQITGLEKEVKELTTEKTELQHQLTGNQTIVSVLQGELNNTNTQLTAWKSPLSDLNSLEINLIQPLPFALKLILWM